jgi:general secretion pathway protein E
MAAPTPEGVVSVVADLLRRAVAARASDLHCEPGDAGLRIRLRVDGVLHDVETLPAVIAPNVIARLKVLAGLLTYRTDIPQEGAIAGAGGAGDDIRVATFPTVRGERAVLRFLGAARQGLSLGELGFGDALADRLRALLTSPQGLLIVCGPAGSGKTTTLYAALRHILAVRPGASIIAVEDPVELRLDGVTQVQVEPARQLTYPVVLRSLLRQDPQVLMLGEVRDAETAHAVTEAALTGHLLLTTLHSGTPAAALVRLRELGIAPAQLTSTVHAVLAQRLLRTVCPSCGGAATTPACPACLGSGYRGRVACAALIEMAPPLRAALLAGADVAELAAVAGGQGLRADADRLVAAGLTTAAEVARVLGDTGF